MSNLSNVSQHSGSCSVKLIEVTQFMTSLLLVPFDRNNTSPDNVQKCLLDTCVNVQVAFAKAGTDTNHSFYTAFALLHSVNQLRSSGVGELEIKTGIFNALGAFAKDNVLLDQLANDFISIASLLRFNEKTSPEGVEHVYYVDPADGVNNDLHLAQKVKYMKANIDKMAANLQRMKNQLVVLEKERSDFKVAVAVELLNLPYSQAIVEFFMEQLAMVAGNNRRFLQKMGMYACAPGTEEWMKLNAQC